MINQIQQALAALLMVTMVVQPTLTIHRPRAASTASLIGGVDVAVGRIAYDQRSGVLAEDTIGDSASAPSPLYLLDTKHPKTAPKQVFFGSLNLKLGLIALDKHLDRFVVPLRAGDTQSLVGLVDPRSGQVTTVPLRGTGKSNWAVTGIIADNATGHLVISGQCYYGPECDLGSPGSPQLFVIQNNRATEEQVVPVDPSLDLTIDGFGFRVRGAGTSHPLLVAGQTDAMIGSDPTALRGPFAVAPGGHILIGQTPSGFVARGAGLVRTVRREPLGVYEDATTGRYAAFVTDSPPSKGASGWIGTYTSSLTTGAAGCAGTALGGFTQLSVAPQGFLVSYTDGVVARPIAHVDLIAGGQCRGREIGRFSGAVDVIVAGGRGIVYAAIEQTTVCTANARKTCAGRDVRTVTYALPV